MDFQKINSEWVYIWLATITALWGGVVSYFRRVQSGMAHSWRNIIIHLSTAGFAGLMCWLGCLYMNAPGPLTAILTGLAGHMGVEFIKIMEDKFESKLRDGLDVDLNKTSKGDEE